MTSKCKNSNTVKKFVSGQLSINVGWGSNWAITSPPPGTLMNDRFLYSVFPSFMGHLECKIRVICARNPVTLN